MSVKIALEGIGTATIEDGKWKVANGIMQDLLIGIDEERMSDEVGYHPWPDLGIAELAVSILGGEIVEVKDQPKFKEGAIY